MNNLLQQIDGLKKELEGLQPIEAEFQRKLDRKFRLEFNYNSNHLEGNTLTYGETELLLYFDQTKGDHTMREYEEMQAHDLALKLVKEWAEDLERPLSEADIKELNKIILVKPFWKDAITPDGQGTRRQIMVGEYKKYPNSVRLQNGEMFDYASPTDTPIKMGELIQWFRSACEKGEMHPVELAARLHHQFVLIHPFDDGNGRISRLLMNYVFWRFGFPPIVIKSSDKQNYLRALNRADVGEMEFFVEYIGKQVLWSLELSVKAAKGESVEEVDDVDKELELLRRELASKDTIIKKKAELESLTETINDSLIPLFQFLENKLNPIQSYFLQWGSTIWYNSIHGEVTFARFDSLEDFKNHKTKVVAEEILTLLLSKGKPVNFYYGFILNKLFKSDNLPDFNLIISVLIEEYSYSIVIKTQEETIFKLKYGEKITHEQMGQIINPLVQDLIEQIRQSTTPT
ncbi:MAG: Fic family protein [Haliscomenobacter sp.]|uniref:Fic family protein n=1 Tax=Haliscomenobacter sp. TaxID=2717303 RepID=UPI0029A6638B|nr:Fic family protein [Haliscomenobacter sp.]MDX2070489.1 Fic family protein [Haliscomenobacter sp.]